MYHAHSGSKSTPEVGWNIRAKDRLIEGFSGLDTEAQPPGGGGQTFLVENSLPCVSLHLVHFQENLRGQRELKNEKKSEVDVNLLKYKVVASVSLVHREINSPI